MRTKTLLLFVFLLTGMAFSQQGGTGRISLNRILSLLSLPAPSVVTIALEKDGYQLVYGGQYSKGNESFEIYRKSDLDPLYYCERTPGNKRVQQLKEEALKEGFKVVVETDRSWAMEGHKFLIRADAKLIWIEKKK